MPDSIYTQRLQLRHLVKQTNCLRRASNPCCCACQSSFEIIGTHRQELITDMQCLASFDAAEIALTGQHAPRLVTDIDEDVAASVEGAEWKAFGYW